MTLVSEGNLFLEKVFEANPLVKLALAKAAPDKPGRGSPSSTRPSRRSSRRVRSW